MKPERLIELICRPQAMSNDDLKELAALIQRYPYFQAARVLYLRSLHIFANARFRGELKKNTIHIADHKQLYKYLNNLLEFDYLAPAGQPPKDASLTDIVTDRIREINGYLPVNTFGVPASRIHSGEAGSEEEMIRLDTRKQPPPALPSREPELPVISNPIQMDGMPGLINDYEEESPPEPRPLSAPRTIPHSTVPHLQTDTTGMPGFTDETPDNSNFLSFTAPIELIEEEKPSREPPAEFFPEIGNVYRLEADEGEDDIVSLGKLAGELKKTKTEKKAPHTQIKKEQSDLIDRFIVEEPTLPKGQLESADEGDLYEESSREKEDLFSETLAKIYLRQGLYEKAIATYIKLSLKYPEKSVYFANRIEKIKAKTKNNE
ncbi:MAG: hypothetical protein LBR65_09865 [Culturomica sp.]|jgi:hypothetical protein|nr:hypothetical protein [Culturomica sp.]